MENEIGTKAGSLDAGQTNTGDQGKSRMPQQSPDPAFEPTLKTPASTSCDSFVTADSADSADSTVEPIVISVNEADQPQGTAQSQGSEQGQGTTQGQGAEQGQTSLRNETTFSAQKTGTLQSANQVAPLAQMADRAAGVLIGQACGNALGMGYEFLSPPHLGTPRMLGSKDKKLVPGQWGHQMQLSICLAEIAVTGIDLTTEDALDAISQRFLAWRSSGEIKGDATTRVVLEAAANSGTPSAKKLRYQAAYFHRRTKRTAGSGALGRVPILGLSRVNDPEWNAASIRAVCELTHVDPIASDGAIILGEAIRWAVTNRHCGNELWPYRVSLLRGVHLLPQSRQEQWRQWLQIAQEFYYKPPVDNSGALPALQAVMSVLKRLEVEHHRQALDAQQAFSTAIEYAIEVGGDTTTLTGLVGALMGAVVGALQIPQTWVHQIHGWPGLKADALGELGLGTALAGVIGAQGMSKMIAANVDLQALVAGSPAAGPTSLILEAKAPDRPQ